MDETFSAVLQQSVEELATRYDVRVTTDLDVDAVVSPLQCEGLLRIVGEAVRNGARHGGAQTIHVSLRADPLWLTVTDDGAGFVPATAKSKDGGFGLTSMRERAEGLGASFTLDSTPGTGTQVSVRWS